MMAFKKKQKKGVTQGGVERKTLIFALAAEWIPARHPCEGREGMTVVGQGKAETFFNC